MQKYQNNIADRSGNAVAGLTVTVTLQAGGGLATIYSDNAGNVAPNPLTTDANGYFEFYAADGRYNIDAPGGGYHDVLIADTVLIAGAASASASAAQASATSAAGDRVAAQTAASLAVPAATTATEQATIATTAAATATAAQTGAQTARTGAETARTGAETAQQAAMDSSGLFVDLTAFGAAVADGKMGGIKSADPNVAYAIAQKTGGVSSLTGTATPSKAFVDSVSVAAAGSSAYLGYVEASSTKGVTTPDSATITSGFTYGNGIPTPSLGRVPTFRIRMAGAGTGEVHFYTPDGVGGYTVAKIIPVTVATGVNALSLSSAATYWPAGTYVHYKQLTGGYPRYDAGGLGSVVNNTAQVEGAPLAGTLNKAYANTFAIAYDFVGAPDLPVATRLGSIEAGSTSLQKNQAAAAGVNGAAVAVTSYGDTTPNANTITAGFTYGNGKKAAASGYLESFSVGLNAAGTGRIVVCEPIPGSVQVNPVAFINVTAAASGVNTWAGLNLFVKKGSIFQYARITGGYPRYVAGGAGSEVIPGDGSGYVISTPVSPQPNTNTMAIAYTLRAAPAALSDRIDTLDASVAAINVSKPSPSRVLETTRFSGASLPAGWAATGWTVNDGLTAPVAGGWDVVALSSKRSSMARRHVYARIKPADTTGVFGLCSNQNGGGLAALIDGTAGKLRLYSWTGGATAGTLITEVALPAALVSGRWYLLEVIKDGFSITVKVTDTRTQQSATLNSANTTAQLHGRPGIMQVSGAPITVDSFDLLALYPSNVRAVLIGDSNLEGTALAAGQKTWGYQLAALRSEGDIVVAGRAGDTTANFIVERRATDLQSWTSAKYVVIALGTNDTDLTSWHTNIATMISDALAIGAEPILCTLPPRTGRQTFLDAANAEILSGSFGRYRYIDFASAVTVGNDRVTWDAQYQTGDNTHYNALGQSRILAQVMADAPFLVG
jgi:lysophospholipase L1-like esterase